ncbi:MAG: HEAT repeat domain-containing protein [Gemmatales bacterium]|nr:HEAT repeat domain-containing protein [Gemmatales bacterium]MCS7159770.1 HEAT repeat domain-containing protein [Gemmatales bacterium]MDW8174968.1 HEAT repeat domain-containing protein [Gemmatales bacterium]MDW8222580.1 HEAT repeat domain-containing protein [Gemmatales bacterium]
MVLLWWALAGVALAVLGGILGFWLRQRAASFPSWANRDLSAVTLQHIALYQGGQLDSEAVEAAKRRFERWLAHGQSERVAQQMQPGTTFLVHVRALAEIGSEEACRILESQVGRRLTEDQLDQAWYWIDLASSLRALQREQSLPLLLDCIPKADEFPLVQYLAAEVVCFASFADYLDDLSQPRGRAALRTLLRAVEGLRFGVPPQLLVEARLGELILRVSEHMSEQPDPLLLRLWRECQRLLRRRTLLERAVEDAPLELEMVRLQLGLVESLQSAMTEYVTAQGLELVPRLRRYRGQELRDALWAVHDLRLDAGEELIHLYHHCPEHRELIIAAMRWSRHRPVAELMRQEVSCLLERLAQTWRRHLFIWPRRAEQDRLQLAALLFALRSHDAPETETLLLTAACHCDPGIRAAAVSSLGWLSLYQPQRVLAGLRQARRDADPEVRQAARASLARHGERQALQWFTRALRGSDRACVLEAIQSVVVEHLTLLWPELDRLADADDPDIACLAREGLVQMLEEMDYRRGV